MRSASIGWLRVVKAARTLARVTSRGFALIRDQCAEADVPLFWKQHVENGRKISLPKLDGRTHDAMPAVR